VALWHAQSAEELGPPVAHLALADGTPVYDRDGNRIGVVEHVMDVGGIFEGVVIHTHPLPGHHLYADPDQITEIRERGVMLSVGREDLHDPRAESAHRQRHRAETTLEARIRRAWDRISRHT
jgi:uncharacterized protein YrrD